jgi:hypothetical protein
MQIAQLDTNALREVKTQPAQPAPISQTPLPTPSDLTLPPLCPPHPMLRSASSTALRTGLASARQAALWC